MTNSRKFIQKLFIAHVQDVTAIDHLETTINTVSGVLISLGKNFPEHKPKFEGIRVILLEELNIIPDNNTIMIYFKYSLKNTNIQDDIQISFNND